ncbi:hypothetical protein [Saccharopolyspora flava]|uniref:Uncharacterized protein n=1 Tax=Saccharopolyspora flava TaxID=95161 RepID=A0A1I6S7Y4_9PSEU|nr:hypothetical protein [Saccharopolyspora flava]SFS72990.1 hypothetical protein SAMN05660874_02968 [Saccharopolyspora flava]
MLSQFGKKSAVAGAAAALVAAPLLGALTAQAAPSPAPEDTKALLSCDLSGTAEFAPALSANPLGEQTQMKVEGSAKNCAPAGREAADVQSATFSGDLSGTMS